MGEKSQNESGLDKVFRRGLSEAVAPPCCALKGKEKATLWEWGKDIRRGKRKEEQEKGRRLPQSKPLAVGSRHTMEDLDNNLLIHVCCVPTMCSSRPQLFEFNRSHWRSQTGKKHDLFTLRKYLAECWGENQWGRGEELKSASRKIQSRVNGDLDWCHLNGT